MELSAVEVDSVVTIHYSLSLADGEVVDSSQGREPMAYLHGHGNIVPGLEEEITGRKAGETVAVVVPPEKGYGERDPKGEQAVPLSGFPDDLELKPGMMLGAEDQEGNPVQLHVLEVGDTEVKVDLNHPLAGETLHFQVEVVAIRAATQEELAHGHVHGPGGHAH